MGRGTAILRYGSALHSRRLPGPSTQRLFGWLEAQLDMRGIDPAVYSRYLISLLQLDDAEFERSEVSDQELDSAGPSEVKRAGRRSRRKKQQQQQQEKPALQSDCQSDAAIGLASGVSSRKRAAAVQCLQSACNDPYELDELIDELCYRLRRLNAASTGGFLQPSRRLPLLAEEDSHEFDSADSDVAGAAGMVAAAVDEDSGAAACNPDSGQAGTPEESAGPAEEYVCAFPALAEALDRGRQADAEKAAGSSVGCRVRSAWARGPPRSLHSLLPHHQQHQQQSGRRFRRQRRGAGPSTNFIADEGFLEGDECDDEDEGDEGEAGDDDDGDDAVSVTSEGSEILQLVSHILHSFNREIEDELAAAAAAANAPASNSSNCAGANEKLLPRMWPPLTLLDLPDSGEIENCGLLTGMSMMEEEAELLSDHDFDNLPSQEEEMPPLALLDIDDNLSDEESIDSAGAAAASVSSTASVAKPTVAMATGMVALPADLVLGRMAEWTSLDRLRCQMWSRKPLPPKPQPQQQQHQRASPTPARGQPMTPLEKSKRACSFLLRGRCKKEDCEFAHDLNRVICKFWSAGECFKGDTCPFLHGSPAESDTDD